MKHPTKTSKKVVDLPLNASASAKAEELSCIYSDQLIAEAKLIAFRTGAEHVSAAHVERAYHTRAAVHSGRVEAAKVLGGATFGVGVTLFPMALDGTPVNVALTVCGALAGAVGLALMVWGVSRR